MEVPVGGSLGNSVIVSIGQTELFGGGVRNHSAATLGNPTRRLDDGTGMDLEILKVLFEEIETRVRVSMPSILVWSTVKHQAGGMPAKPTPSTLPTVPVGASQRLVITRTHAPTCTCQSCS